MNYSVFSPDNAKKAKPMTLAGAITSGNLQAEQELVGLYHTKTLNMLKNMTRDPELSEDIVQETFMVVLESLRHNRVVCTGKVAAYIFQTAKFIYLGGLRKQGSKLNYVDDIESHEHPSPGLEAQEIKFELRVYLIKIIMTLKIERDREVLMRFYIHDQDMEEICEALTLSSKHFYRVLSRARTRLKSEVNYNQELLMTA